MPEGYIELTEAITQTIKLWFGEKFTIDLASVESLRKELTLPTKQRRDRRWNFVRSYYRRAFIQKDSKHILSKKYSDITSSFILERMAIIIGFWNSFVR